MFPVLFSIGGFTVSSFGIFLALGFLFGIFLIWRLARAWDLDEEKVLDLMLLTFVGAFVGARVYFALENWNLFVASPFDLVLINKIPGFSFWGGFLGGWLTLYAFARRKHIDFWQFADIAVVGFLGGLILSNLGCFFGGCNVGIPSKVFFAVTQVGSLGKRWPIQIIEALILAMALGKVWSQATHFHQRGKIVGVGLILIGIIQLMLEPLKQNHSGAIFSAFFIILGATIFYRVTKKNPINHLKSLLAFPGELVRNPAVRKEVVQFFSKSWYNQKTNLSWRTRNWKKLLRRFNVKLS